MIVDNLWYNLSILNCFSLFSCYTVSAAVFNINIWYFTHLIPVLVYGLQGNVL